jgi:hypothetical protein
MRTSTGLLISRTLTSVLSVTLDLKSISISFVIVPFYSFFELFGFPSITIPELRKIDIFEMLSFIKRSDFFNIRT